MTVEKTVIEFMDPRDLGFSGTGIVQWRRHQWTAVKSVCRAFWQEREYVVLNAPTGAGKSVIGVAAARLLARRTLILVATKLLAEQYEDSLPGMVVVIKGRANYPCPIYPKLTAADAPCDVGAGAGKKVCRHKGTYDCPYYAAKKHALGADVVVTNYQYALNELNWIGRFARPLLILDEAHRAEQQLMKWVTIEISRRILVECGVRTPEGDNFLDPSFATWVLWASHALPHLMVAQMAAEGEAEASGWATGQVRAWRRIEAVHDKVAKLSMLEEPWLIDHDNKVLRFRPIWVGEAAYGYLFRHGEVRLLMSATPPYLRTLGLKEDACERIEVPSTFPVENRPFVYEPFVSLSYRQRVAGAALLVEQCDAIFAKHPDQKGVVHTVSYWLRDVFMKRSKFRDRMITHDTANRVSALERFKRSKAAVILISPSMAEGVSLDGNLARFQIVAKVPWPSLGDEQIKVRMQEDPTWYQFTAATAVVQAYGRIVRGVDDWGTTYCFDKSLRRLLTRREMFPMWFLEAVSWDGQPLVGLY